MADGCDTDLLIIIPVFQNLLTSSISSLITLKMANNFLYAENPACCIHYQLKVTHALIFAQKIFTQAFTT